MAYGLSQYGIGIRQDIEQDVVNTLSYLMNELMICNPLDPDGSCPEGNFASMYEGRGGTGDECGYVQNPEPDTTTASTALYDHHYIYAIVTAIVTACCVLHI